MYPRRLVRKDADARLRRLRPRRVDDGARLGVDEGIGLAPEAVDVARLDDALTLEPRDVERDRIARHPVLVELPVRIALIARGRILPRGLWIAAEIQHVVVVRVAAHAHGDELDEGRPQTGAGPLGRPSERAGDRFRIRAIDCDARHA